MNDSELSTPMMTTLRFHTYGEPADVLRLDEAAIPEPGPGHVRVRVHACGLNPADWALCRGLFPGNLPRGIGLDVSGTIDAIGEGVVGIEVGDKVLGAADYAGYATAGASEYAILHHWTPVPPNLDLIEAAALPLVIETAFRYLAWLGVTDKHTLLVSGGGTMIGFAAVQMGLMRGARVIATAGETFAERLRALGATVTAYGDGMVERIRDIADAPPDLIFDTTPVNLKLDTNSAGSALPDLVKIAGGDPRRIITCTDFGTASQLGVRTGMGEPGTGEEGAIMRWDILGEFAQHAAEGRITVPIAHAFPIEEWREALAISLKGRAHGKLLLLPANNLAAG